MQQRDLRRERLERALPLEHGERRQRSGAGEWVARVRVTVEERPQLLVVAQERLVDALGRERRGERHVAAGQPLRDAHEVRRDVLLLAGEHRAGTPEAGRDLVADEQHVVLVAQRAHVAQVAVRVREDARRALHERLDDDRRDATGVLAQQRGHRLHVAGLGLPGIEQQRAEARMEEVDAADGDRSDRVAVVRVAQADEAVALGHAAMAPVLEGHLQGDLAGRRAVVGVEDALQAARSDLHEPVGELDRARMREAEHRRVRHAGELVAHGAVDRRMAVAVDVAPQRRDAVEIAVAVRVVERATLGALDDQRLLLAPALLLGERVPERPLVDRYKLPRPHGAHTKRARGRIAVRSNVAAATTLW